MSTMGRFDDACAYCGGLGDPSERSNHRLNCVFGDTVEALDELREAVEKMDKGGATLATAVNNWLASACCPGMHIADGHYSGCNAEHTKAHDCPICGSLRIAMESVPQHWVRRSGGA